jgi:beta-lactamase regulating signal transducer with metallopeptidase domain/protocatechuate 3,4-dioxygenase beta subunit
MMFPIHDAAALLHVLAVAAAKGAGVLAVAALVALALRRASAALRHLVWTLALAVTLLLPLAAVLVPAWHLPLLPARAVVPLNVIDPPAASVPSLAPTAVDQPSLPRVSSVRSEDDTVATPSIRDRTPAVRLSTAAIQPSIQPRRIRPPLSTVLLAIWATGSMAVTASWIVGLVAVWRLGRRSPAMWAGPLFDAMERLRTDLGIRRRVVLHVGGGATMPVTWGTVRPHVALPADAIGWPAERLRVVLLHELSHVRRHDCATQLLAHLCCAVHWFDPLAWLAAARMRAERERACDDAALRHGTDPAAYAEVLLAIARSARGSGGTAVMPMARRSGLRDRVAAVLNGAVNRGSPTRRLVSSAVATAAVMLVATAAVRLMPRAARGQQQPAVITPTAQPATRPAVPLPSLPVKIPSNRAVLRVLGDDGTPMPIDDLTSIFVWIQPDMKWTDGPKPTVLGRYDGGWVLVDGDMFVLGQAGQKTDLRFTSGGTATEATGTLPKRWPQGRQVTFKRVANPTETQVDLTEGPAGVAADEVAGRVVDPAGRPVAGAVVSFPQGMMEGIPDRRIGGATTGADGVFRCRPIKLFGFEYMQVVAPGYAPRWIAAVEAGKGFTVRLDASTRLRGQLRLPGGAPAAGAKIELFTDRDNGRDPERWSPTVHNIPWTVTADGAGRYDQPLEAGEYDVHVTSPGGGVERVPKLRMTAGQIASLPEKLSPAVPLTLEAVDSVSGRPVAGVRFELMQAFPWAIENIQDTDRTTGGDGRATWAGLVPGQAEVGVAAAGFSRWWLERPRRGRSAGDERSIDDLDVDVSPAKPILRVMLEPAILLTGRVVAPDGTPVPHAAVDVGGMLTGDSRYAAVTDANGSFSMQVPELGRRTASRPVDAEYAVVAYDPWRRWANGLGGRFAPAVGAKHTDLIHMSAGGRVRGRVVDGAGRPVARIEVEGVAADGLDKGYYDPRVMTDGAGRFDLGPMRPGTYTVYADTNYGVNLAPTAVAYPNPIDVAEGDAIALGDLTYTGPPPPPVPEHFENEYPDFLRIQPPRPAPPQLVPGQAPAPAPAPAPARSMRDESDGTPVREPTVANVPPVVVATVPPAGAADVDPSLTEIRATFSKRMEDGGWSWVQVDPRHFPQMTGGTHYEADHRTCVLPVRLEPRHTYEVWLNSDDFQNFTDRDGRPAEPYPLVFRTR